MGWRPARDPTAFPGPGGPGVGFSLQVTRKKDQTRNALQPGTHLRLYDATEKHKFKKTAPRPL